MDALSLYARLVGQEATAQAQQPELVPAVTLRGSRVLIDFDAKASNDFWGYVNAVKALPGRKYEGGTVNSADPSPAVLTVAERFGLGVTDEARAACESAAEAIESQAAQAREMLAASRAEDAELDVPSTVAMTPRPYQKAGVLYALNARRTFIGDEQGLGKTMQAQVTVEVLDAYPTLVVCKAKLRGNWKMEIGLTLPDRKVQVLEGQKTYSIDPDADFVVINYDILDYWAKVLIAHGFKALVVDESQYIKNHESRPVRKDGKVVKEGNRTLREYKTKRVRAVKQVADSLPEDAPRLLLTGTAMFNRPIELASQLDIMGRLDEFGGFFPFAKRYANAHDNGYGMDFTGHSNEAELREKLRSTCLVRRKKEDVAKDIPGKTRVPVWLMLNGELSEYNTVFAAGPDTENEAGEMAWMSTLRRLVGQAKVDSAVERVEEILDVDEGEEPKSVLVFAHHKDVQAEIAQHFGNRAVTIFAGDRDEEVAESKRRFQAGEVPVLVGSLEAASEGHTLTRAADVVMVERAWTPKREEQAEDRVHRIGQTKPVTIHYVMAMDTIDEDMDRLVESKRAVIDRVQDGDEADLTEAEREVLEMDVRQATLDALMERRQEA